MAKSQTIMFAFVIDSAHVDKRDALVRKIDATLMLQQFRVLGGEYIVTIKRKPRLKVKGAR
jgi:hypothetical protein